MKIVSIMIRMVLGLGKAMLSKVDKSIELKMIKPATIFHPYGIVVNQSTYANIPVYIDVTNLFEEDK